MFVVCWRPLPALDLRPRCLLQNWDLLSSARQHRPEQTQLIGRTLHACSDLCRSEVQKHCQYRELCCLSCSALITNTNDRLVRSNDHIIPDLASQVTVSVLRFICVDLKILTALFGIFLQYQLNCYWLDHKTCSVESCNISHQVFSHRPHCSSLFYERFLLFLPWWVMTTATSPYHWNWTTML